MPKENPTPQVFGLIGYPARHSLSPVMQNAAFQALGINAQYRLFELREKELSQFLGSLPEKNIFGLNVTVPYKEKVLLFLDDISPEAKLIGAVNTIKVCQGKLKGFNTDAEGFFRHLSIDLKFNPRDKNISLIGAGGAAKAVLTSLLKAGPKNMRIFDIDKEKLAALVRHLKEQVSATDIRAAGSLVELKIENAHLLINATPVGMKESDPCLVNPELLHKNLLVYDLIYNPPQTKLLKVAREKGAGISNGLGMLLYQGALAFEIWTGKRAPLKVMQQALKEAVKKI